MTSRVIAAKLRIQGTPPSARKNSRRRVADPTNVGLARRLATSVMNTREQYMRVSRSSPYRVLLRTKSCLGQTIVTIKL